MFTKFKCRVSDDNNLYERPHPFMQGYKLFGELFD